MFVVSLGCNDIVGVGSYISIKLVIRVIICFINEDIGIRLGRL